MLPNWKWDIVWRKRDEKDFEFSADQRILEFLGTLEDFITHDDVPKIVEGTGYSRLVVTASLQRLLWCAALRYKIYNPPDHVSFRLSGKPARRRPLDGKIFRGPTPEWDGRWKEHRDATKTDALRLAERPSMRTYDTRGNVENVVEQGEADFHLWELDGNVSDLAVRVAALLADGASKTEVAEELGISNRKIKKAMQEIRLLLAA